MPYQCQKLNFSDIKHKLKPQTKEQDKAYKSKAELFITYNSLLKKGTILIITND